MVKNLSVGPRMIMFSIKRQYLLGKLKLLACSSSSQLLSNPSSMMPTSICHQEVHFYQGKGKIARTIHSIVNVAAYICNKTTKQKTPVRNSLTESKRIFYLLLSITCLHLNPQAQSMISSTLGFIS